MTARLLEAREPCTLLKSFIARQGVILIAGLVFLAWTASAAGQTRGLVTAHHCSEGAGRLLSPEGAAHGHREAIRGRCATHRNGPLEKREPQGTPCHTACIIRGAALHPPGYPGEAALRAARPQDVLRRLLEAGRAADGRRRAHGRHGSHARQGERPRRPRLVRRPVPVRDRADHRLHWRRSWVKSVQLARFEPGVRPLGMTDHSGQLGPRGAWVPLPRVLGPPPAALRLQDSSGSGRRAARYGWAGGRAGSGSRP